MKTMKKIIKKLVRENLDIKNIGYHGSKRDSLNWNSRNENPDYNMLSFGLYLTSDKNEAINYATNNQNKTGFVYSFNINNANILPWIGPVPENVKKFIFKNYSTTNKENYDFNEFYYQNGNDEISWDYLDELPDWAIKDKGKIGWFIMVNDDIIEYGLSEEGVKEKLNNLLTTKNISLPPVDVEPLIFYEIRTEIIDKTNIFTNLGYAYTYIYYMENSTKQASLIFKKLGIDGVNHKIDTSDYYERNGKPLVTVIYDFDKISLINKEKF